MALWQSACVAFQESILNTENQIKTKTPPPQPYNYAVCATMLLFRGKYVLLNEANYKKHIHILGAVSKILSSFFPSISFLWDFNHAEYQELCFSISVGDEVSNVWTLGTYSSQNRKMAGVSQKILCYHNQNKKISQSWVELIKCLSVWILFWSKIWIIKLMVWENKLFKKRKCQVWAETGQVIFSELSSAKGGKRWNSRGPW